MEETAVVKKLLGNLEELVGTVSSKLQENILDETLNETLEEIARIGEREHNEANSELSQAKLLNLYSYILVSLYFTSLKLNGSKFNNDSPIMQEIKRVKEYMDRVKKAEDQLIKKDEKQKKETQDSKNFIKRQLHEPAVSKVHFEDDNKKQKEAEQKNIDDTKEVSKIIRSEKKKNSKNKKSGNISGDNKRSRQGKVSK